MLKILLLLKVITYGNLSSDVLMEIVLQNWQMPEVVLFVLFMKMNMEQSAE